MSSRALLLSLPLLLLSAPAFAAKKVEPVVAVWSLQGDDIDRAEAEAAWARLAEAIDAVPGVAVDRDRPFPPEMRTAEGIAVAIGTARRWQDAAWLAMSRREHALGLSLADEALALVSLFAPSRLPDAMERDLHLLRARLLLDGGDAISAREAIRAALSLDPTWEARVGWERKAFSDLVSEVRAERLRVPPGTLDIACAQEGAHVLISGVDLGAIEGGRRTMKIPPGRYEVVGRKAGYADDVFEVQIVPGRTQAIEMSLEVQNSAPFQDSLGAAIREPSSQRGSPVWDGLALASMNIEARGILVGQIDGRDLHFGLFLPGRRGWAFWRSVRLGGDGTLDADEVDGMVSELQAVVDRAIGDLELAAR